MQWGDYTTQIIVAIIGIIGGILIEKFKSRVSIIKFTETFFPLGWTTNNNLWGDIVVTHNGRTTNHISSVTYELRNESNKDLKDVNVEVWVSSSNQILGNSGNYVESGHAIFLEKNFQAQFDSVLDANLADIQARELNPHHETPQSLLNSISWVLQNRKFILPVFNRHTSVKISLLVENFEGNAINPRLSILHPSTKLIRQIDRETENKKRGISAIIIGSIIFLLVVAFMIYKYQTFYLQLIILGVIGVSHLFIGIYIDGIIKYIKRAF